MFMDAMEKGVISESDVDSSVAFQHFLQPEVYASTPKAQEYYLKVLNFFKDVHGVDAFEDTPWTKRLLGEYVPQKLSTERTPHMPVKTLADLNYNTALDMEMLRSSPYWQEPEGEMIVVPDMFAGGSSAGPPWRQHNGAEVDQLLADTRHRIELN
jgi:hypothetical protein